MDAIVFDWDGTLVDSMPAIMRANSQVFEEYGVPFDLAAYRAAYAPDWRLMYRRLGVAEAAIETAGARWLELYSASEPPLAFPDANAAVHRLAEAGFVMGVVSAGHRHVVEEQIERFGLGRYLPVRVCGDDTVRAKPHPEPLLRALDELGAGEKPERAIIVGDSPDDMRMARAVGATGIGIVSVIADEASLVEAGASEVWGSVGAWVGDFLGGRVGAPTGDRATR